VRMQQVWSIVIAAALVTLLALPGLAQGFGPHGMEPYGPGHFGPHRIGPGLWIFGTFFLLGALLVLGLLITIWRVLATRTLWQKPDSASQIVRERYARGEIGEDEYRKRLATLN
jgi:putative membrane protein